MKKLIFLFTLLCLAMVLQAETLTSTKQVIKSNTVYIIPDGVTLTGIINLTNVENVTIKADNQAYIIGGINFNGHVSGCTLQNLDISGGNICIYVRSYGADNTIIRCTLHDCTYGIWLRSNNDTYDYNSGFTVKYCRIYNTQNDGYYGYKMHSPKLLYSIIYRNNMLWKAPETDQKIASGDGVQWILVDNPVIDGNIFDRSATGNKFCLIISGTNDVRPNTWQISNNTFILPIKTGQGGAGIYIYDLKASTVVKFDFNTVTGAMAGIKFNSLGTFKSSGNEYKGLTIGIELQKKDAKGYSVSDSFVNCARKTTANVIVEP